MECEEFVLLSKPTVWIVDKKGGSDFMKGQPQVIELIVVGPTQLIVAMKIITKIGVASSERLS